jgi:hypothetical protein
MKANRKELMLEQQSGHVRSFSIKEFFEKTEPGGTPWNESSEEERRILSGQRGGTDEYIKSIVRGMINTINLLILEEYFGVDSQQRS